MRSARRLQSTYEKSTSMISRRWGDRQGCRWESATSPTLFSGNRVVHTSKRRISILGDGGRIARHSAPQQWHVPTFMAEESPETREKWLEGLLASDRTSSGVHVDAEAYLVAIEGWSKSRHKAAARRAEDLLIRLERHFEESEEFESLRPRVEHYNAVIGAWAGSQEDVSIVRAERWLNKLRGQETCLCPNTDSYNRFLDACSKGHGKRNDVLKNNAIKAEQVLKEMMALPERSGDDLVAPNTESFNYVIRAWTRCRQDMSMAEKVMEILRLMELYQRTGEDGAVKANTISYCMAIDAFGTVAGLKCQRSLRALQKKRNRVDRNNPGGNATSLDNTAGCAAEDLGKAESILRYMHDLSEAGDINVSPTTDAYNTYIAAFARTANEFNPKAPLAAEGVLRKMIAFRDEGLLYIQPDQRSYVQVMRAWGKARRSNSGERAEWWLRNMWTEYEQTGNEKVRPNVGAYLAVMEAYFHQANVTKLESLLLELLEHECGSDIQGTDNNGNEPLVANTAAFTFVIRGWLKHEDQLDMDDMGAGCEKALGWLDKLMDREDQGLTHAATSPELYTGIIKTAKEAALSVKTTKVSKRVLKTALEAFTEFRSSRHAVEPNAYAWIMQIGLKALSSPADDMARVRLIQHLSKACCEDGYVSKNFVNALSNGPIWVEGWTAEESEIMTKEIFGDWPMPKSWSRNISRSGDIPKRIDIRRSRTKSEDWHLAKQQMKARRQTRTSRRENNMGCL